MYLTTSMHFNYDMTTENPLTYHDEADRAFFEKVSDAKELREYQLISGCSEGHITWNFDLILKHGAEGFKKLYEKILVDFSKFFVF